MSVTGTGGQDEAQAQFARGENLALFERWEEAVGAYDLALGANAEFPEAWRQRGLALRELGEPADALASFDAALRLRPQFVDAHDDRANALRALGRDEEAVAAARAALALDPQHSGALNTLGHALRSLGRLAEALEAYEAAVRATPNNGPSRFNRGACRLLSGDFARGWHDYEFRWRSVDIERLELLRRHPLWRGQDVGGKKVLLYAEQGLGDTIQFCRYASLLVDRGAEVTLAAPPRLRTLLTTLRGVGDIVTSADIVRPFDFQSPLLSLPLAFQTRLETIPAEVPYLSVPDEAGRRWRERLGPRRRPRVGLAWSGNPAHAGDASRSLPLELARDLAPDGVELFCLQLEIPPRDVPALAEFPQLNYFDAELKGFHNAAALIAEMDLVISVDTSILHLAGALGAPTWGLLSFACDWRWMTDRSYSPWYPTVRLFRQSSAGDWRPVIAAVRNGLERMVATYTSMGT